jgi:hypothetical protein
MQKMLTISLDTKQIKRTAGTPFTIQEVESLNEWLALGWEIEEWDFLKEGETDGDIVLLVILNDDAIYQDDEFDEDFESGDEDFNEDSGKFN